MMAKNGQQDVAVQFHFLDVCCRRISETYGKPDRNTWTNGDYVELERILFKKSHVRISPNTLKRIFGKIKTDARYYPQKATRDVLALYIGYPDWDEFVQRTALEEQIRELTVPAAVIVVPEPVITEPPTISGPAVQKGKTARWFLWAGLVVAIMLTAVLLIRTGQGKISGATLVCSNPVGENPHSAVFAIRPEVGGDITGLTLKFGDGKRRRIERGDSVYTHYYERPGRYYATLWQDDVVLDSAVVYLVTNGWTATGTMMHDSTRVYPILQQGRNNGRLYVSTLEVMHAGIDTNRTFFVEFCNTRPTPVDGDNFELTTVVKTSPERAGVRCSEIGVTVFGESALHSFDVMRPGCVHWIDLQLAEKYKNGQHDDLSFLGADLRRGGKLTFRVEQQVVRLFINDRQVYQARYRQPLRRIYGAKIQFAGIGTIDSFQLRDLKTKRTFAGNF